MHKAQQQQKEKRIKTWTGAPEKHAIGVHKVNPLVPPVGQQERSKSQQQVNNGYIGATQVSKVSQAMR